MTGTAQPANGAAAGTGKSPGAAGLAAADLELIDDQLEDEHKTDADIWKEMDAAEGAASDDPEAAADEAVAAATDTDAATEGDEQPPKDKSAAPADPPAQSAKTELDWSKAPPELRAEHEALVAERARLEQSERSQRGRVSALQRQHDDLLRRTTAPAAESGTGTAKKGSFQTAKGKTFSTEYPDVAAPVAEEIEQVRAELAAAKQVLDTVLEDRTQTALNEQLAVLTEQHPDWRKIAAKGSGFAEWVTTQPTYVQEAAKRNAKVIVDAEEAADLISRFKDSRSEKEGHEAHGDENHQPAPEGEPGKDPVRTGRESTGTSLSGKRQRQLASSAGARGTGPGAAQGIPEDGDPEEIWKAFDRKDAAEARERQARRA